MAIPHVEETKQQKHDQYVTKPNRRPPVWDCGSTLYDSFEVKSFERQLTAAINSRTLSMPHLTNTRIPPSLEDHHVPPPPPPPKADNSYKPANVKKPSKISRSLYRLFKSMFRLGHDGFRSGAVPERHVGYDNTGALTTIPEAPPEVELGGFSPDFGAVVGRTVSERFPASSIAV